MVYMYYLSYLDELEAAKGRLKECLGLQTYADMDQTRKKISTHHGRRNSLVSQQDKISLANCMVFM